jgi:hypothetical protein
MAHPPNNFRFFIRMLHRSFRMPNGASMQYADTMAYGSGVDDKYRRYEFWLPIVEHKPVVSPDVFAGMEDAQLDNFLAFLGRFASLLDRTDEPAA